MKKVIIVLAIIIAVFLIFSALPESGEKAGDSSQDQSWGNAGDVTKEKLDQLKSDIEGIEVEDLPDFTE